MTYKEMSKVRVNPQKVIGGWKCERHGQNASWLGLDWQWYPRDNNHRSGRYVPFHVTIGCRDCCEERRTQILVLLTRPTKSQLVNQVLYQALRYGLLGYLGKTDVSRALRGVYQ
jgi:hypothetical protein